MNLSYDVIVVGGGVVGLSAAIAMNQRGFSVALIDAGALTVDTSGIDSRVYAINNASQSLLQALGAWDYLDKTRVSPYKHMHVWDAVNGAHIDFDARMVGMDRLGTIIEESIIREALLKCSSLQAIHTFPHSRVVAVHVNSEAVCLKCSGSFGENIRKERHTSPPPSASALHGDGLLRAPSHKAWGEEKQEEAHRENANDTWQAKLLIIADGAASATRQLLGVSVTSWPYHQQAIVTTVHTEKPHQCTAYQVFNQDGPLAFLPLADAHQCSIVWSTTSKRAEELLNLHEKEFAEQITKAFAAKLGHCRVVGKRHQFPLHMRHTKQYCGARWLLMGDAAHTIHPMAGLGLNVGLADLAAWCKSLDISKDKNWSSKMLHAYQRERKYHVWQMIALMEGLKTAFASPLLPVTILRGLGLRIFNHVLLLKKLIIEQAATLN